MVYELRGISVKSSTCMMGVLSELSLVFRVPKALGREREGRGSALPLVGVAPR